MSELVYIQDVGVRDGFQSEPNFVPTDVKVALIDELSETGLAKIEVTAFVSPKAVPAMRDAAEVMVRIKRVPGVIYSALVPNARGAEGAVEGQADEINIFMSASESHNLANVNKSTDASFEAFKDVMRVIEGTGIAVNGTISTSFGCPFEGHVEPARVLGFVQRYLDLGIAGVTLADTTGMANPAQVRSLMEMTYDRFPDLDLTLHFHNTRGMGLANVIAGLEAGCRRYDGSLGGLGGCPFAPGATGNICPRTWCTCSGPWAMRRALISTGSSRFHASCRALSAMTFRARCGRRASTRDCIPLPARSGRRVSSARPIT